MEVLNKIANNSKWTQLIFNDQIIVRGRILSPSEAEGAALSAALVAAAVAPKKDLQNMQNLQNKFEKEETTVDEFVEIMGKVNPAKLLELSKSNDQILCSCIQQVSDNNGKTWEQFKFCMKETDQKPNENIIWVGLLNKIDKESMLDHCMQGHLKARERIMVMV